MQVKEEIDDDQIKQITEENSLKNQGDDLESRPKILELVTGKLSSSMLYISVSQPFQPNDYFQASLNICTQVTHKYENKVVRLLCGHT